MPLRLSKADKRVIQAFTEQRSGSSKKLFTDGNTLDGNWMGGGWIAYWKNGKIVLRDVGSRAGQTVHRAVQKEAPANWITRENRGGRKNSSHHTHYFGGRKSPQWDEKPDPEGKWGVRFPGGGIRYYATRKDARAVARRTPGAKMAGKRWRENRGRKRHNASSRIPSGEEFGLNYTPDHYIIDPTTRHRRRMTAAEARKYAKILRGMARDPATSKQAQELYRASARWHEAYAKRGR